MGQALTTPASHEIEVSLFGPGYGECELQGTLSNRANFAAFRQTGA